MMHAAAAWIAGPTACMVSKKSHVYEADSVLLYIALLNLGTT